MSKQIALYPEQMKHLEELGLDTSDADLIWEKDHPNSSCSHLTVNHLCGYEIELFLSSYAYTLQNIIDHLPLSIYEPADDGYSEGYADLRINKTCVWYESWHDDDHEVESFRKDTLLDSAYEMLCWCLENKSKVTGYDNSK